MRRHVKRERPCGRKEDTKRKGSADMRLRCRSMKGRGERQVDRRKREERGELS
ncbi:hypothetical protein Csa_010916, partial [Cucumis sativus]